MKRMVYLCGLSLFLLSCQQNLQKNEVEQEPEDSFVSVSDVQEAAELNLSLEEAKEMTDKEKDMRRASIKMTQYISLDRKERKYSIDISESKALEIGIDKENYQRVVSEIESLNKALLDFPDIKLIDPKEQYKIYKNKLDSTVTVKVEAQ